MNKLYQAGRKASAWQRLTLATLLATLAGTVGAQAQGLNYGTSGATSTTTSFVDLGTNGTVINVADPDDDVSNPQSIGFPFAYNGQVFTQFVLGTNGFMKLGNTPTSDVFDDFFSSSDPADNNLLFPLFNDLVGTSTSYRVATSGTAPNRVCTIQWGNMTEYVPRASPIPAQFTNFTFQVKLYETTNNIEFVYGPNTPGSTADEQVGGVGLKGSGPATGQLLLAVKTTATPWASPTFQNTNYTTTYFEYDKNNLPTAGQTFRFAPDACSPPAGLNFTSITTTSAVANFTVPGAGTDYSIIYGPSGFNPASAGTTVTATASPYTLSGLTAGNVYDVYIRSNCGGTTQSTLAGPFRLRAACSPASIVSVFPYTENFDGVASGDTPCDITVADNNNDNTPWIVRSTVPTDQGPAPVSSSSPNAIVYYYNEDGTTPADDWFFTPGLFLRSGYTYQLSFKYRNSGTNYPERMEVKYGTGATPADQTTTIWQNANIATNPYVTTGVGTAPAVTAITPTANGVYYIGFHAYSLADQFFIAVDDLQVTQTAVTGNSEILSRAINVYPNPSTGAVTLEVRNANAKNGLEVEITNMLGQRVFQSTVRDNFENKLRLDALANGMYVLKVKAGNEFTIRNLSIQK
ncbi:T9SS type A sorting domain-containing protein [Hymenobacter sp. CRA2]|uniref:T9SS type A sorting domain-containing protein n=1 Tax=Hymenobacter sp. CRA2 TaxID=1955620 RepID=UPI00098EB593|nr:T9SS type A sorting domain-containing protein [Hymenobacter sp. CRA2]OON66799.1 hypothetical protein B0919_20755 [Hymenobacter sp. CRA2]